MIITSTFILPPLSSLFLFYWIAIDPTVTYVDANASTDPMNADNLDEARFADRGFSTADYNCTTPDTAAPAQFGSGIDFTVSDAPYVAGTTSDLQEAWDNVVLLKKRIAVLQQKMDICDTITGSLTVTTNVGRQELEASTYKTMLGRQKAELEDELGTLSNPAEGTARYEYQQLRQAVIDNINNMNNNYQPKVDAANSEYNTYYATAPAGTTYTKPTGVPTAQGTSNTNANAATFVVNGEKDAPKEDEFEKYLTDVYGVAYKDTLPNAEYADGVTYAQIATYSRDQTKGRIDNSLTADVTADPTTTSTHGVVGWTTSSNATYATVEDADQSDIENSPYYKYKKIEYMETKRTNDVAALNTAYTNLAAQRNFAADPNNAAAASGNVILYVNLDNLGDGTVADKWQRVTDTNTGTDFDFYYTGILQSGETSSLLVKSVEFDPSVTQDAFLDLNLDINIALQSAQAVYQGDDIILPTSANATITGAKTTAPQYGVDSAVAWTADASDKTAITDKDPNPTANDVQVPTAP